MKPLVQAIHLTLLVTLATTGAIHALHQISVVYEQYHQINTLGHVVFYASLSPDTPEYEYETIVNQISQIPNLHAHIDRSIPSWDGEEVLQQQWLEMWERHLPPLIYATMDLTPQQLFQLNEVAGEINHVQGVNEVQWDEASITSQKQRMQRLHRQRSFLTVFYSVMMVLLTVAFILAFPHRYRRRRVVQTGFWGAGSQIVPELVLGKMVVANTLSAIFMYSGLVFILYSLYPVTPPANVSLTLLDVCLEGSWIVSGLVTGVFLIGWWLPSDDLYMLVTNRAGSWSSLGEL